MAEDVGNLVVKVALENSNFQKNIQEMNRQIRGATAEFKNSTSGLGKYGKSLDVLESKSKMLSNQVEAQSKILSEYKNRLKESKDNLDKNAKAQVETKAKLEELNKEYENSVDKTGKSSEESKKLKSEIDNLSKEYQKNEEKIRNNVATIENWEIKNSNAERKLKEMEQSLKETSNEIETQSSKWTQLGKKLEGISNKLDKVGKKAQEVGKSMTKKLTLPIAGVATAAAKMGRDLNKSLGSISTLIPGQRERLLELKGDIQDISIAVAKSTDEIADGTYGVISAYGDASDTMEKVELNAKGATAGVASTEDALNLTSAVMKGFGDTSAEANEHVLDLAFQTLKLGQTSFPELGKSIGAVVPLTNELGISQEELFSVYATGTGVTGNASEVSTQYQGTLKALMAPTKEMTSLYGELGVANGEALIEQEGYIGAIEKVVSKAKETGTPLQKYIGSIQGQTLALALAGEQSDNYKFKLGELENSSGSMEQAFNEQTKGIDAVGFTFDQSMQKMKVASQNLGETLAPTLSKIGDIISSVATKLSELNPHQLELIAQIGMVVASLGPLTFIGGKLATGIGGMAGIIAKLSLKVGEAGGAMAALNPIISALTGPIGIIIASISALVATTIYLYNTNEEFRDKVQKIWTSVKEIISSVIEIVSGIIKNFVDKATELWDIFGEDILDLTSTIWNTIAQVIEGLTKVISGVLDVFIGMFTGDWERFGEGLDKIWQGAWKAIKAVVSGAWGMLKGTFNLLKTSITKWFKKLAKDFKDFGVNIIKGLGKGILATKDWVVKKVKEVAESVSGAVKDFFGIKSPSRLMRGYGENITEGLAIGIEDNTDLAVKAMEKASKLVAEAGFDESIKRLSIETGSDEEDLLNTIAIVEVQKQRIESLSEPYNQLSNAKAKTTQESEKLNKERANTKKELESAKTELIKYEKAVKTSTEDIVKNRIEVREQMLKEEEEYRQEQIKVVDDLHKDLVSGLKKRYEEEGKAREEAINKELKDLDKWKDESIKRINSVYDSKIKKIDESSNKQIKALEDELKALDKSEQEKSRKEIEDEYNTDLSKLEDALEYEHDEYNKEQIQKEIDRRKQEHEKQLNEWSIEDKKESLNKKIEDIRSNAEEEKEILENKRIEELEGIDSLYNFERDTLESKMKDYREYLQQKTDDAQLQAEAEKMIVYNQQEDILDILEQYEPHYEKAGHSLGEKVFEGAKPQLQKLVSMINSINSNLGMDKISTSDFKYNTKKYDSRPDDVKYDRRYADKMFDKDFALSEKKVSYTVNNYSPKALNPAEQRRKTMNELKKLSFEV